MEEEPSRIQEISVDQAKTIDTTKVAYFTLTDGTLVVVKPKDEINKGTTLKKKKIIETKTVEINQGNTKLESPGEKQDEDVKEKKNEGENNEEEINTNAQNKNEEENQENFENQRYEDQEIIEGNYDAYQNPQQVEYYEDEDEEGGKVMSYGGIIEERRNYRFYASGIEHLQPETQEQQIIEQDGNQEYIQEQIDNEEDQRICNCSCHYNTCEHCCGQNRYKLVETVPVETVEYVEECPRRYANEVRYVVEREPEYVPCDGYIVEEVVDDNNYNNRYCCHCNCGHKVYYDDYNGEYYEYVDEPRCTCRCPLGCREYVRGKRYVRYVSPK